VSIVNVHLVFWSFPITSGNLAVTVFNASNWTWGFHDADLSLGELWVIAQACNSTPALGATLSVSGADSGLEYVRTFTTDTGSTVAWGSVVDLPVGTSTLTTTHAGTRLGTMNVNLRPGVLTSVVLGPTP